MAEILHQLIGSFSHYLQGFIHPRWCRISSINSSILKEVETTSKLLGTVTYQPKLKLNDLSLEKVRIWTRSFKEEL